MFKIGEKVIIISKSYADIGTISHIDEKTYISNHFRFEEYYYLVAFYPKLPDCPTIEKLTKLTEVLYL